MPKGGGKKRIEISVESVTVQFPEGLHGEMVHLIQRGGRWFDRQEFIKEAVREKIERERVKSPNLTDQERRTIRDARPP